MYMSITQMRAAGKMSVVMGMIIGCLVTSIFFTARMNRNSTNNLCTQFDESKLETCKEDVSTNLFEQDKIEYIQFEDIEITNEEDIKFIIDNLEDTEYIQDVSKEENFWTSNPTNISIVYEDGSGVTVIFLQNGNIIMDLDFNNFKEYKLINLNFKKEFSEKYNIEINDGYDIKDSEMSYEYVEQERVTKVVVGTPCKMCTDPIINETNITDEEEIKYILNNIESAEFIRGIPEEIGFGINPLSVEITYDNDKASTIKVIFLGEYAAIDFGSGIYKEYRFPNYKFRKELLSKYQK